jgi:hypothetical protein
MEILEENGKFWTYLPCSSQDKADDPIKLQDVLRIRTFSRALGNFETNPQLNREPIKDTQLQKLWDNQSRAKE